MNFTIEEIISEDLQSGKRLINHRQYHSKYVDSFLPVTNRQQYGYKLYHDDDRPALKFQEMLLWNSLRWVRKDYDFKYKSNFFLICKEHSYSSYLNLLNSLESKGYINIVEDKRWTYNYGHIIHKKYESQVDIICLAPYGKNAMLNLEK